MRKNPRFTSFRFARAWQWPRHSRTGGSESTGRPVGLGIVGSAGAIQVTESDRGETKPHPEDLAGTAEHCSPLTQTGRHPPPPPSRAATTVAPPTTPRAITPFKRHSPAPERRVSRPSSASPSSSSPSELRTSRFWSLAGARRDASQVPERRAAASGHSLASAVTPARYQNEGCGQSPAVRRA